MSLSEKKRQIFNNRRLLREVYKNWYEQIKLNLATGGKILEIGSGVGLTKEFINCITSDIIKNEFINRQEDACNLSFNNFSLDNIIGIDIFHHLNSPDNFLKEAARVLRSGGRIVLVEPYLSPVSLMARKLFHHEKINFTRLAKPGDNPEEANLASPTILFKKDWQSVNFKIIEIRYQDVLAYPLSGGFSKIKFTPNFLATAIIKLDKYINKLGWLNRLAGFKMIIVLEKIHISCRLDS